MWVNVLPLLILRDKVFILRNFNLYDLHLYISMVKQLANLIIYTKGMYVNSHVNIFRINGWIGKNKEA